MIEGHLIIWTIYERPLDYPDGFVARPWEVRGAGEPIPGDAHYFQTLEGARNFLPEGMYRLGRSPGDDGTITESWI